MSPISSEEKYLLDCGVVGGNLVQLSGIDVSDNTDWYFGFKGDVCYYPTPRIALGATPFYYIYPAAPSVPEAVLLGELGLRAYLDYDIRPHRSFRFFVGASHSIAYSPKEEGASNSEDNVVATPLRLSLEVGVALLLHL